MLAALSFNGITPKYRFICTCVCFILGLVPHVAAWGKLQIDNALGAAGTGAASEAPSG
jgi:hypothetical protein